MVAADEPIHLTEPDQSFVSRGGLKLAGALDHFPVSVDLCRALDVGASTGGFTDCLLEHGASHVVALDVGYGQIHWRLRQDPRVDVVERTNFRTMDVSALGEPFDVVVADLSFISLGAVVEPMERVGSDVADWILLIKPQFEAGRGDVGKGGIVRDPDVRSRAVVGVAERYERAGLHIHGLMTSPITGTTGNIEYVAWFRRELSAVTVEHLLAHIKDPVG